MLPSFKLSKNILIILSISSGNLLNNWGVIQILFYCKIQIRTLPDDDVDASILLFVFLRYLL